MLDRFVGNYDLKSTVKSAVKSGRFPHAFIIEGEQGSGRYTFAKMLASAAICQSDEAPCGKCRACTLTENEGHCDVLTYAPDGATFKIDTVRHIRENAFIYPLEAKRKVNILRDADKMNEQAQNALLKILEEPPEFMVFILLCRNASSLLSTVRSRCVTLSVKAPEYDDAFDFIKLKSGFADEDIKKALENSHNNIGAALKELQGNTDKSVLAAKDFLKALLSRDRLSAAKIVYSLEKDRMLFLSFLSEEKILLTNELKCSIVSDNENSIPPKHITAIVQCLTEISDVFRTHIGKPLSVPLWSTKLLAQIFSII